jgi:gamma-glutamyltranspeptidase/glutathione hydrolase
MKYLACAGTLMGFAAVFAFLSASGADPIGAARCDAHNNANPAFCHAWRGDRIEGWPGQNRSEVMARNGMVTTSQPLATAAGLEILRKGGNAVDAAVAAAAVLNVTEPMNVGMGGDLFAIIYTAKDHKLHVLNASGKAASGQTLAFMNAHGYRHDPANNGPGSGMPRHGILSVTVPGAAWGWQEVLEKYGTLTFKETLEPAASYAEQGFPVSERVATEWLLPAAIGPNPSVPDNCCTALDPDSVNAWYVDGKPPAAGQIYRNADLARTFRLMQAGGRDAFYKGAVARATVAKVHALGGTMTLDDLANYKGEWVEPVVSDYHGYALAEVPPPSQGWAANEMLNILAACTAKVYPGMTLASLGPTDPRYWHLLVEAKRLAYADLIRVNGDPDFNPGLIAKVKSLITMAHAESLCGRILPDKALKLGAPGKGDGAGDTVVLSTADRWGNMVAWVNSNFSTFGSGITVPGYGFMLHNRGGLFTLDPKSPNVIVPQKRPFNTLSAAFVMAGGKTDGQLMTLLLMGGDEQAQGHAQMMVNMVDLGANLQATTDMARFHHDQVPDVLDLETEAYGRVGQQLRAMGHTVRRNEGDFMGGYQGILFNPLPGVPPTDAKDSHTPVNGYYRAGSDARKDGAAQGW